MGFAKCSIRRTQSNEDALQPSNPFPPPHSAPQTLAGAFKEQVHWEAIQGKFVSGVHRGLSPEPRRHFLAVRTS